MADQKGDFLAAIDLGSNSFHLKVARVDGVQLRTIDRMREMVQLAKGLDEKNKIKSSTSRQALECLEKFGQRLRHIPAENIRAVGTNTLRKARQSAAFLRDAEQALGHQIDIISGREEARLVYLGVAHSVQTDDKQRFVIDIGGGSTELIIGRKFKPMARESLYMGCVSMSQRFFADGRITQKRLQAAEVFARQEFESLQSTYQDLGWDIAIGASGTIKAVLNLVESKLWAENTISMQSMQSLNEYLLDAGHTEQLLIAGLDANRAAVLPGGFAILKAAFDSLKLDNLVFSDGALREGLLYDMLGRLSHEDVRDQAIDDLCERYHVDQKQAKRVSTTAETLRAQVEREWGLRKSAHENLLAWAARCHEIGLDIAHSQYHRHSAYLVEYSDLAGFSREEQQTLAAILLSHRRKLRHESFANLPSKAAQKALRLTVVLRLAILLNRSRRGHKLPDMQLQADDMRLRLQFPADWLADHPLTEADLAQEVSYLQDSGIEFSYR